MTLATTPPSSILWFEEIGIDDIPFVGGKNASLGELFASLKALNILNSLRKVRSS
jgi:pyruvate,water dikinase